MLWVNVNWRSDLAVPVSSSQLSYGEKEGFPVL